MLKASNKNEIRNSWRSRLENEQSYYLKFSFVLIFENKKLIETGVFKFYYPSLGDNSFDINYNLDMETMKIEN